MASDDAHSQLKLFGVSLAHWDSNKQLLFLAFGAIVCATLFAALQEKVFVNKEVKQYGGFVALLQTLTYAVCGYLEMRTSQAKRKASWLMYAGLCCLTQAGMLLTNWSLAYLTYPTRVIFKSSKVIPVMLVSVIVLRKSYSAAQYAIAIVLVAGICIFTLGDKTPDFNIMGVILISLGVVADALTSNLEEKYFFKKLHCSHAEVVCFASAAGAVLAVVILTVSGELSGGMAVTSSYPEVYPLVIVSSAMGYVSVVFVLLLIQHFGATAAEVAKSCRKVISIVLSFVLYSKPVTSGHVVGFLLFVAAIVGGGVLKSRKERAKKEAEAAAARSGAKAAGAF